MNRRYDIDWIRVIAIGLLLLYHVAIAFQPWGMMIGFIANPKPWMALWTPMTMLNIWRIPLLFFVSGMGVCFASQARNWKQLIAERTLRILLPLAVGMIIIVPVHVYIWQRYYNMPASYISNAGHLWFLGNIFIYVLLLSPVLFLLKKYEQGKAAITIKKVLSNPLGLLLVVLAFIAEALILDPVPYELYAMTWHGFFLGLLAFFFGFCFIFSGEAFWNMMLRWRWFFILTAITLYSIRLMKFQMSAPVYLLVTESDLWIFSILAFAYKYLNRPSPALHYLSQAAYPVYILHMIFLFLASLLIFPLNIATPVQFTLVLLITFAGCFILYEFVIRRVKLIRPLFGLKATTSRSQSIAMIN
ncbi:MAG TPA: acyltransferase family protein [Ohtaekwangia sp.]|uniref:acyltransferase family protein n=1 Tax=Ohtaekwangia sp. TaxID=2066019 RepID=UPI002F95B377